MAMNECIKRFARRVLNARQKKKYNVKKEIVIGKDSKVRFSKVSSCVKIGDNCNIEGAIINEYSYLADNVYLPQTKVGKFCSIAAYVKLAAGNHPINYVSTSPYTYSPIRWSFTSDLLFKDEYSYLDVADNRIVCEIGNDVWIGTGSILVAGAKGLHIGDGAIIAAGSVVTKDVPDYAIIAGNPAKVIRYRFSDSIISELEKIEWWEKDRDWISNNSYLFRDPNMLIELCRKEQK